ncbi:MAG: membrane protein insertase YidC [Candidatus Methylomirabilia bacterium]
MDKRTILAVGLIILVIGAYNLLIIPKFAPPPTPVEQAAAPAVVGTPAAPSTVQPLAAASASASGQSSVPAVPVETAPPENIAVDRPLWAATFTNVGGGLVSWGLKTYTYAKDDTDAAGSPIGGTPLEIVRPGSAAPPLSFTFVDPGTQAAFSAPMAIAKTADGFTLTGGDSHGLRLSRTYSFSPEKYLTEMRIFIENNSDVPRSVSWEMAFGPGLDRHLPEKQKTDEGIKIFAAGGLDSVSVKKVGERKDFGPVTWVAIGNRYFLAALLPMEGSVSGFARRTTTTGEEVGLRSELASLGPRQAVTFRVAAYLGPKDRKLLATVGKELERGVDYGWFWWLAIPFLHILQFCFSFLRSWGLAIVALTLLVKASLFPISFKMFRSMKKMQELQPKMAALKTKFKGDNQGLQQATMAIYKEHKVNPMAGCLPMVVQIPVFFALYKVLYNAIELRGAGFLYIPDLSLKDPYYITPILMGVTMLIQQRMTPSVGDPMQAKMMMFMPVIMTAMFINFSSGLVLYFLFSNIMSIGEQKLFRVIAARGKAKAAPEDDPGAKPGKKKRLPKADR